MLKTTVKPWPLPAVLLSVAMLAATAVAEDAKEAASNGAAKPPPRQMLYKIFAPLMHDIGARSPRTATIVSGPVEMKMANNNHEDQAEFARLYAFCLDDEMGRVKLRDLEALSPARFALWERMLELSGADKE